MGKTIEQKLIGATNKIRECKKESAVHLHKIKYLTKERDRLKAEQKILNAKLKSSEMFISYLQNRISSGREIKIPLNELYAFAGTHDVAWIKDDNKNEIRILTIAKNK